MTKTKTETAQDLVGFVICDGAAYMDMMDMLKEPNDIKKWAKDVRTFAYVQFDSQGHFFNIFDMNEIDWEEFAQLLFDADPDAYDNW